MIYRLLLVIIAAGVLGGCKKQAPKPAPTSSEVKITEQNLDSQLDKMENEIDADIATEQGQ